MTQARRAIIPRCALRGTSRASASPSGSPVGPGDLRPAGRRTVPPPSSRARRRPLRPRTRAPRLLRSSGAVPAGAPGRRRGRRTRQCGSSRRDRWQRRRPPPPRRPRRPPVRRGPGSGGRRPWSRLPRRRGCARWTGPARAGPRDAEPPAPAHPDHALTHEEPQNIAADARHTSAWRASAAGPIAQDPTRASDVYPATRERRRGRRTSTCGAPGRRRLQDAAEQRIDAFGSDDDEVRLGLQGDEGDGIDRRALDDDALGEGDAALNGGITRLLDDGVGLVLGEPDPHIGDGGELVDASLVPRRDGVEAGDEEKSGVAQASHLAGAIDDVGVRLDIADSGDNGGIGHG